MAESDRHDKELTSWNPFRELDDIQNRMSRLLESTFGGAPTTGAWSPPVDIEETDDTFVVEAELPDVKREDIDVELKDNELSIRGDIKERERTGVLRRQTRRTGRFDYRVTLPGHVEADRTEASLKDGVLRLTLHKSEGHKRRRIEISGP
ncbi:Hsp20/alpha crystallin family protein [Aeromicrobium sp.]|uniref:Hsp20/alpha crystallin family protein n=1 Tax=Aeromicrobium sp. TaxID=1871063 RepID=UPI002FCC52B5